ncbi:MAG: SDR family oxidoreductase [Spirochaetaceae bacterium]|jgi:nucleoside-diphosphate-sugar epimerase|nr:SDR family oxidoreductase [Spirochaetaceae bacterium]
MKALFIGGTGTISAAISRLALEKGDELFLLNRGNRNNVLPGKAREIKCDINDEESAKRALRDTQFDVVADFLTFTPEQVKRDFRLFQGKTRQYIAISSASVYQKPLAGIPITESTPLMNPFWEYARNKIAVEQMCVKLYREYGFPVTIVRPSHTYDERSVPLGVHGANGSYQVLKRILDGKPVIIHGDGTSLWTITHNTDFARGFYGLLGNVHAIGQAVGITSEESVTWNQIYQFIADALEKPLQSVHIASTFLAKTKRYDLLGSLIGDKAASVVFDMTKLKRLVPGYAATVRADQGIRATVEYVMTHKECQREDPEFDAWCDRVIAAQEKALALVLDDMPEM